jgi:hypothetical protein
MARYLIERTPNPTGTIYEIYSEERTVVSKVAGDCTFPGCRLTFSAPDCCIVTFIRTDSLEFTFEDLSGRICGYVREAKFSTTGKSIVENGSHGVIGSVKSGFRSKMTVFSDKEETLAIVYRNPDRKIPFLLWPAEAHLLKRYVLETVSDTPLDSRLFFCVVCLLVGDEWQSSSS